MEVTQLRTQKSRFDIFHKGKTIRFHLEGCGCENGVHAIFSMEMKKADLLPSFIPVHAIEDPDEPVMKSITGEHIILKWYERLFGITLKWKIERWAKKERQKIINNFESEDRAERLQAEFV